LYDASVLKREESWDLASVLAASGTQLQRWDFLDGPGLSGICSQSTGTTTAILDVRSTGTARLEPVSGRSSAWYYATLIARMIEIPQAEHPVMRQFNG
jgi:hypothetical protein